MEERELKKSNKSLLIMFIIFLIILGCVVVYFKLFGNNDEICPKMDGFLYFCRCKGLQKLNKEL